MTPTSLARPEIRALPRRAVRALAPPTPRALLHRALPGPWPRRVLVRESVSALALGALSAGLESIDDAGSPRAAAVGAVTAILFLLRRGLPGPAVVLAAGGAGWMAGFVPVLVVAGWSGGRRILRPAPLTAFFAAAFLAMAATVLGVDTETLPPPAKLAIVLVTFMMLAVLPAVVSRYLAQRRTLLGALRERNEQLLRERSMVAHQARLRERHRIAQDMHDSLGHQLALIAVHTGALEVDRTLTGGQREAVGVLRQAATGAMRELREVVGLLRDDTVPEAGGVDTLERLADASRAAGTDVTLRRDGEPRPLGAATGHGAYRIVQEGLTNAHKHAPGAPIAVSLRYEPDTLVVEVVNGPAGEPPSAVSGGQGLTGLRERARLLGGIVHAGPTPDGGYRLAGLLPYDSTGRAPAEDDGLWLPQPEPLPVARRGPVVGCAVGAAVVLLVSAGVVTWGGVKLADSVENSTVPVALYEEIAVGTPEDEVLDRLPAGSDFLTSGYEGTGPQPPADADCRWFSTDDTSGIDTQDVVRFCFRDGLLIDKQHYRAKV
ncbi:histidine kinase [Kitasatospora sp. NBC_00374]|uniref:sensor histidine kinase n=1 Tax=Kitasatospora sp. NBC_00374 TaxID=2975964 RepID=UPI00324F4EA5